MNGKCESISWNPISAASADSALAGVIAGLVFAGIILLLQRGSVERRKAPATSLFIAGFFTFALSSFMLAVIAGEQTCGRAWTETMLAAGTFGIGGLGLFTGIAWLLHEHEESDQTTVRVTTAIASCLAGIIAGDEVINARWYLRYALPGPHPAWLDLILIAYLLAIVTVIVGHLVLRTWLQHLSPRVVGPAAYAMVAYVMANAVTYSWLWTVDEQEWAQAAPRPVAIISTIIALGSVALALVIQLLALPAGTVTSTAMLQEGKPSEDLKLVAPTVSSDAETDM